MTTNYQRGRDTEYKVKKELEKEGYVVFRTAGSHGVADIIAINSKVVRLIQVKRTKSDRMPVININEFLKLEVPDFCTKEVWIWFDKRRSWSKRIL